MLKFLLVSLIFSYPSFSMEEYKSTYQTGKNKYQRIQNIEKYMSKFSKNYNTTNDTKFNDLQKRLDKLTARKVVEQDFSKEFKALRKSIKALQEKIESKHKEEIEELKKEIVKVKEEAKKSREDLTKSLLNQILAINKILSNYEKVRNGPPIR